MGVVACREDLELGLGGPTRVVCAPAHQISSLPLPTKCLWVLLLGLVPFAGKALDSSSSKNEQQKEKAQKLQQQEARGRSRRQQKKQ